MENFAYFFKLLTKDATDDDHYKVSDMPENLQVFATLETNILDEIIKNGVTLEFSHMKLPKLKRGDFDILRKMSEAKKCGYLLMINDKTGNQQVNSPESKTTSMQTESESSDDSRNSTFNRFDISTPETSDKKEKSEGPDEYEFIIEDIPTQTFFLRHF